VVNAAGEFSLTGGSLVFSDTGKVKVGASGLLDINGGILTKDFNASTASGSLGESSDDGMIKVQSGGLQLTNGTVLAVVDLRNEIEVSGGDVDIIA
jgi:hypothetical protein